MILVLCSLFFRPLALIIAEKLPMHAGVKCGMPVGHRQSGAAGSLRYRLRQLVAGVPFAFTPQLRVEYLGSFWHC